MLCSKGKIQRKCQNLGGHYTLASPHSKFLGDVSPRPPMFTPLGTLCFSQITQ